LLSFRPSDPKFRYTTWGPKYGTVIAKLPKFVHQFDDKLLAAEPASSSYFGFPKDELLPPALNNQLQRADFISARQRICGGRVRQEDKVMSSEVVNVTTVVIADEHQLFRQSLATLLESCHDFRVIGEAATGGEAIQLARDLRPDIVLLDTVLPVVSGLTVLRELGKLTPAVRTLVLTSEASEADIVQALQLGARGVLLKQATSEMLFRSVRAIVAGEYWIGRDCVGGIVQRYRESAFPEDFPPRQPAFGFTARQLEIIAALVAGATNRDIAKQLSISATTVKYHLSHMFDKAGVSNRVELALFALQHRLHPTLDPR
jgi:two-component system nitrate/nitrite response regulator NarL